MTEAANVDRTETEARTALKSMIGDAAVRAAAIADLLDALSSEIRAPVVRGLDRSDQHALYQKVEGYAPIMPALSFSDQALNSLIAYIKAQSTIVQKDKTKTEPVEQER